MKKSDLKTLTLMQSEQSQESKLHLVLTLVSLTQMPFVCLMIDNAAMKIYVFDEWYKTGVTNKIIAQAIKDKGYGGQKIICDSAEPKSIAELQEEGIKAEPSRKGKDSVNHGIQLCQNYEIIVHERNCPEFKKEIQNTVGKQTRMESRQTSLTMNFHMVWIQCDMQQERFLLVIHSVLISLEKGR